MPYVLGWPMIAEPLQARFPFQVYGAQWLGQDLHTHRFLADEMGLGKSVQAITAVPALARALVICPAGLRTNWAREVATWAHVGCRTAYVLQRFNHPPAPHAPWTVCSYEYALENAAELSLMRYDVVILDEAHYVCRRDSQRTDAVFGRGGAGGIARSVGRVWWLTGTPILTSPADLWLPFRFAGYTSLTYDKWCEKFCFMTNRRGKWHPTGMRTEPEVGQELQRLVRESGFVLRRLKEDVLKDLPPLFYTRLVVEPGLDPRLVEMVEEYGNQLTLEMRLVEHAMSGAEFREDELAVLQGLAQSTTTLRRYLGLQKVGPAVQMVSEELKAGAYRKILIGCEFLATIAALVARFHTFEVLVIEGDTPQAERYRILERFHADPNLRVLVMQTRAGGVGLNITAADQVLCIECPWTPAQLQQLAGRCHRIGQARAVTARVMSLSTEPMDEAIVRCVVRRARHIREVLSDDR